MSKSVVFKEIYNQGFNQELSQSIIDKYFEKASVISSLSKTKIKELITDTNKRYKALVDTIKPIDIEESFLRDHEIVIMRALRYLKEYVVNNTIDSFIFEDHWLPKINESLNDYQSSADKVSYLFRAFYSIQWIQKFKELEHLTGFDFSKRPIEIDCQCQTLIPASGAQIKEYYLNLSEAEEEGVFSDSMAIFRSFDTSPMVLGVVRGDHLLGRGSYGTVHLGQKVTAGKPFESVAFKAGQSRKDFLEWSGLKKLLSAEELKYFVNDYSYGVIVVKQSGIIHPNVQYVNGFPTQLKGFEDDIYLTSAQKVKLASGWLEALTRLEKLNIFVLREALDNIVYQKEGEEVTPLFCDSSSLLDFNKARKKSDFLSVFSDIIDSEVKKYGSNGPSMEYSLLSLQKNRLMNRVEILTLDEKDQAVEALMALHAEINRFILGLMLFDFITGKQFLSGDLEEYSTENQEMRKIALLEAGCSDTLATTIMNCGSFKKIDVPSSENISLVRRDKFCGYFMETFEGSYFKIAGKIKNIPLRQKNEMAKSLLSSLYIIHKHGYILGDMKLSNMLYSLNGPTARLVLSDYGGLINFKEMLEKPSLDLLKAAVKSWAPNSSLFHEYHLLQNKFDELYEDSSNLSKEEVRARLEEIYRLIHQLERFAVGEALAYLFVKELPYKTVDINTLHVDYRYRKNFCHKLDENTYDTFRIPEAPRKMEKLILGLLNPDPLKRPSFEEIGSYISSK